jgi:hypothetical protein
VPGINKSNAIAFLIIPPPNHIDTAKKKIANTAFWTLLFFMVFQRYTFSQTILTSE